MYCDEYVCLCVCLSVCPRGYLRNHSTMFITIFVHLAYVRGSVFLQHVDDRPHRLLAGRGDGSAQRGRSVIYDCLVTAYSARNARIASAVLGTAIPSVRLSVRPSVRLSVTRRYRKR